MRRFVVLSICLLALVPVFSAAQAAGNTGSISKSWVSRTSGGAREKSFSAASVKKLYANFVWKVPATPGQELAIEWHDPNGTLSARWHNKTIKTDKAGTRLFSWVGAGVLKDKTGTLRSGTWRAVLIVGGKTVSTSKFSVVK
jgi:hypothetical protein